MIAAVAAAAGCGGASSAARPCDPFATDTKAITLGPVLAVGRDMAAAIYVVDEPDGQSKRLFIATGAALERQRVAGTGTVVDPSGTLEILTGEAGGAPITVEVRLDGGHASAMGVFRGKLDTKTFVLGTMGETLQLLTPADIAGLAVQNLPGTISALHVATTTDGRTLLVTSPDVDATQESMRLYFGPPDAVRERPIHPTAQPLSYTRLEFDLDGQTAVVTFASPLNTGIRSEITVGAQDLPLTEAAAETKPTNVTYLCL